MLNTVRNVVILDAGSLASSALTGEPAGLAFDARDMSASVKGHTTNFDGDANGLFTYTSPSTKYVRNAAGLLVPGTTLRCDHDASGNKLGLLIEEQRTTLAKRSRRLDDGTDWTRSNITASTVQGVDGVSGSATRLTATANNATALGATNTSASAARRLSPFVRRVAGTGNIEWTLDGGSTWTAFAGLTSSWQRLDVGATVTNPQVGFRIASNGDSVDIDFANGESGAFATSPMESTASQVTRAADTITLATSAFPINAAVGTLIVTCEWMAGSAVNPNNAMAAALSNTTSGERIILYNISGNAGYAMIDGGSTVASGNNGAAATAGVFTKIGLAYEQDNTIGAINGALTTLDTSCTIPDFTRLNVGASHAGTATVNGHIKTLAYMPRRVSDTELQALSA